MKTRVSGVPYEVELAEKNQTFNNLIDDVDSLIAELERENLLMRARMDRLENELSIAEAEVARLKINLENERNKKS